ncbi:MAG TPA: GNAT family N-acetyltransferase [Tepidisphaeraceae bacterium]
MNVRSARSEDASFIVESNCRMATETESLSLDRETVDRGVRAVLEDASKGRYFLATIDDVPVGQLMITFEWSDWRNGMIWWIQSVYVAPDYRRRGVFTALYDHVRSLVSTSGGVGLRLYVEENNATAQRTYQRMGMGMSHYRVMEEMLSGRN